MGGKPAALLTCFPGFFKRWLPRYTGTMVIGLH